MIPGNGTAYLSGVNVVSNPANQEFGVPEELAFSHIFTPFDTRLVLGGNEYRIKSNGRVRNSDTYYYDVPAELTVTPLATSDPRTGHDSRGRSRPGRAGSRPAVPSSTTIN